MNDRWLRFAPDNGARVTDRIGVGVNYLAVCARVRGDEAAAAQAASDGLRAILGGMRERFTFEYRCVAPHGRWTYRMVASALGGRAKYALVSHTRLGAAEE